MVIDKKNGKMYAEANRVEKLRFLSAMRTEIEFTIDMEAAEKEGITPVVQFDKYCPSADEIERLKSLPPDDYPDWFDFNFSVSVLWFGEIMALYAKANRKNFIAEVGNWLSKGDCVGRFG